MSKKVSILLTLGVGTAIVLAGCRSGPDYTPIGDGLKAIGICLVVYGIVQVLGELVQGEKPEPKTPPAKQRKRPSRKSGGGEP